MAEDFFDLLEQNNLQEVIRLVNNGFEVNTENKYGYSALHIAITNNLLPISAFLIDAGINLNHQDKDGKTALHYVAEYNTLLIAELLLKHKADLALQDKYGNQPLWTAVFNDKGRNERIDLIKLFLQYGADINHKNNVGKSPKDIVTIAGYNNLEFLLT